MKKCDFSGWATRNDLLCSDGRTIRKDAFKNNNGQKVPLVWNHNHSTPDNILGHAMLENRDEGVYAYCYFNDSESAMAAKKLIAHGDIRSLSILANQLKESGKNVLHGAIRELSIVLAGANPGAFIDSVLAHGDEVEDSIIVGFDENIMLHYDNKKEETGEEMAKNKEMKKQGNEKTVADVFNTLNDEQKNVVYALLGQALDNDEVDDEIDDNNKDESKGGKGNMKHNIFDNDNRQNEGILAHADQVSIISLAKTNSVGSLQSAIDIYKNNEESLTHGIENIETLFPDYKDVHQGAPELIRRDQGWVSTVMQKTHKSPISRIRTRQADITGDDLRAHGYKKGNEKKLSGNIKLLKRTTDPQTVFRKDALHRDDVIDITDFDVVTYQYGVMKENLNEEIAMAIMIGDGREEGDDNKIYQEHIRSIWHDDNLYAIHADVDIAAARADIQGSNTSVNFGESYIYAEAIIAASLYSREKYKGSGTPDFYCTPHLLNIMLLARDLNGRRIYDSKSDLAAALNVGAIYTAEQFEGKTRTTTDGKEKKLLGIFVNLSDYQIGSTKGGEITKFNQFDIDFNQEKYLIETRISGALTRVYSAIVLEEPVDTTIVG